MAASAQGIWNQSSSSYTEPRHVATMASSTGQDSSSNGSSTSIAANDFLTLLVTEMKNQDPTATTDPNEYVNQLVQVNSLQQLISINETLQNSASNVTQAHKETSVKSGSSLSPSATAPEAIDSRLSAISAAGGVVTGDPAIPGTSMAAQRIATALTSR